MGTFTRKMSYLFMRKIAVYLALLCISIIPMVLIATMSYHSIRENMLSSHSDSVSKGLGNLDSQIRSVIGLASIIANEKSYHSLLSVSGTPDTPDYIDINTLQSQLAALSTTHDYIMDMYVLFRNNPIYISNFIGSDDYQTVYPHFLHSQSESSDTWHEQLFSASSANQVTLFPDSVYSYYTQPHSYSALTCVVRVSPYARVRKDGILVCNLNFDDIIRNMVQPGILEDCFLYITDSSDSVIGSWNSCLDSPIKGDTYVTETDRYTIVRSSQSDYGFSVVLGIPERHFSDAVRSSFFFIECYFLVAIVIIILFYLFLSLRETIFMRRIVKTSSSLFPVPDETGRRHNEYTYISHVLRNNASALDSLNYQLRTSTLINLFLNDTRHDEARIRKLFDFSFDAYYAAVIKLREHDNNDIDQHCLLQLEELGSSAITVPFLSVHTNTNELSLLLSLDDFHFRDQSGIISELESLLGLIRKTVGKNTVIHIGLSGISSGIEHVHEAYLQARDIINISADSETSDIFVYDRPRQLIHHKTMDISILLKCYDGILCGDTKVVEDFFKEVDKMIRRGYYDLREPLQLLFSVRQPIYNAYLEIFSANEADNIPIDINLPVMDQHLSLHQNIKALKDFSLLLCEQSLIQKQSRQLKLREKILNYICTGCFDINFTVYSVMNEFHVSENYVLQLVKESAKKSFKNYVESLRVEKAEYLLLHTNETNANIAMACGFGSETTFYRAFARKHGVTPSKWSNKS